jgi:hypothetical protein
MAARTLTYTINQGTVKGLHAGLNVIPWDFNSGAGKLGTLSDMVLLGKIPNGALITDVNCRFGASTAAATHWALVLLAVDSLGSFSINATLIASMTQSTTAAVFSSYIPTKVSLSDDRAVQYAVLALNCTTGGSETVSVSLQGSVKYVSDGSNV